MKIIPYKNRKVDSDKPIQVYRNLTRKNTCYSIRQSGKVVGHTQDLTLISCKFVVNQVGRHRVLKTRQKNVHAYIEGMLYEKQDDFPIRPKHVFYNPYYYNSFMFNCNNKIREIKASKVVRIINGFVYAK